MMKLNASSQKLQKQNLHKQQHTFRSENLQRILNVVTMPQANLISSYFSFFKIK